MLCAECHDSYEPDKFQHLCNQCGTQVLRQYEQMQEYRVHNLSLMELSSRIVFGEREDVERTWRVG